MFGFIFVLYLESIRIIAFTQNYIWVNKTFFLQQWSKEREKTRDKSDLMQWISIYFGIIIIITTTASWEEDIALDHHHSSITLSKVKPKQHHFIFNALLYIMFNGDNRDGRFLTFFFIFYENYIISVLFHLLLDSSNVIRKVT